MYTYIAVEIDPTSSNQDPASAYRRTPRRHWICPTAYPTRWAIVCVWGNCMIWTYLTSSCNLVHLKRHPYQHRKQQMLCRAPNRRPQVACMLVRGECPAYSIHREFPRYSMIDAYRYIGAVGESRRYRDHSTTLRSRPLMFRLICSVINAIRNARVAIVLVVNAWCITLGSKPT